MTKALTHQQRAVLTIVLATYMMILLDTSIVITGLPEIRAEFGFSPAMLAWVQAAYTIAFGGFLMLGARMGDLMGRKRVFLGGLALFTLSSLAIGAAPSAAVILGARAVQGLGAAVLAPSTLALLQIHFAEGEERTRALSAYAATAGIGSSLGLVLGGIFAGWLSWRIGFFVNVPVGVALYFTARRLLTETSMAQGRLDLISAATSTLGMAAVVLGITRSASTGWADPVTAGSTALGLVLLAGFFWRQARAATPILPLRLFASRVRSGAYAARMFFTGAFLGFFFLTTQLMQGPLGFTPVQAGLGFLPMTVMTFVASLALPRLTRTFGNGGVLIGAFLAAAIGMGWLALANPSQGYLLAVGLPLLILGLGNGAGLGPLTVAGVQGVTQGDAGAASGLVNTAHQLGGSLGVATLAAVGAPFGLSSGLATGTGLLLAGMAVSALFIADVFRAQAPRMEKIG
ncbi:MFS transporter [bacterium]|nr:MFS transporter [bacterium]